MAKKSTDEESKKGHIFYASDKSEGRGSARGVPLGPPAISQMAELLQKKEESCYGNRMEETVEAYSERSEERV